MKELREFVRKERVRALEASEDSGDIFEETELTGQFTAYCNTLLKLDELETFKEVT